MIDNIKSTIEFTFLLKIAYFVNNFVKMASEQRLNIIFYKNRAECSQLIQINNLDSECAETDSPNS